MLKALSTRLFLQQRLTPVLLDRIARAGWERIELHCERKHLDYRDRAQIDELRRWLPDSPLESVSLRAPVYSDPMRSLDSVISITSRDKAERIRATDEIKRALEIGDLVPFRYFVLPFGGPDEEFDMFKIDSAFNALDELRVFARPLGIDILLENGRSDMAAAEKLCLFVRMTHLPLSFCFDAASAAEREDPAEEFEKMKEKIRLLHLAGASGRRRLLPFIQPAEEEAEDAVDWDRTAELLRSLPRRAPAVLDGEDPGVAADPLEPASESVDRLESLLDG